MRTNIELDQELVDEAFKYVSVRTKKALVHLALTELVERRRRHDMRELRGAIQIADDYDHKELRRDTEES